MNQSKTYALVLGTLVAGVAIGGLGVSGALGTGSAPTPLTQAVRTIPAQFNPAAAAPEVRNSVPTASLADMDAQFADLVEAISPSVVHINMGSGETGSGVIYRIEGSTAWIITNDHVAGEARDKKVKVVLYDGRELTGEVTTSGDSRNDIAVVEVEATGLKAAKFANEDPRVGQYAIAVGAPFGLENTVTIGHISAMGRDNMAGGGMQGMARSYVNMIQTDAAINPGNSGGPLLNIYGEVVGINTSILSGGMMAPGNVGIGFAIPAEQATLIAEKLIKNGNLTRGFLGIQMEDIKPYERREKNLPAGVRVGDFAEGMVSPARTAGLQKGDIITRVGRTKVENTQDLLNAMLEYGPGTKTEVEAMRNGQSRKFNVTVAAPPAERSAQMVQPRFRNRTPSLPEDIQRMFPDLEIPEPRSETAPQNPEPPVTGGQVRLGVDVADVTSDVRGRFKIPQDQKGAVVLEVVPNSVAERAGMQAGDIVTQLGNTKVQSANDLVRALRSYERGDRTTVTFFRFSEVEGGGESRQSMSMTIQF